jgi:hypothetical protein
LRIPDQVALAHEAGCRQSARFHHFFLFYSIPDSGNLRVSPRIVIDGGMGSTAVLLRRS